MADSYRTFTITGVTAQQANSLRADWDSYSFSGVGVWSFSYDPNTSTFKANVGGSNISAICTAIRNSITKYVGKSADIDQSVAAGTTLKTAADKAAGL